MQDYTTQPAPQPPDADAASGTTALDVACLLVELRQRRAITAHQKYMAETLFDDQLDAAATDAERAAVAALWVTSLTALWEVS